MRFDNNNFRSLNESINYVQNPYRELDEALEYTAALESVILSICEELEIDPDELVEDVMTAARERELSSKMAKQGRKTQAAYERDEKERESGKRGQGSRSDSRAFRKQLARSSKLGKRYNREMESHKVYGKGGKVLKKIKTVRQDDTRGSSLRGTRRGANIGWSDEL